MSQAQKQSCSPWDEDSEHDDEVAFWFVDFMAYYNYTIGLSWKDEDGSGQTTTSPAINRDTYPGGWAGRCTSGGDCNIFWHDWRNGGEAIEVPV